jgi:molybdopterin-guanine dinucleotide biosynthesis protein A
MNSKPNGSKFVVCVRNEDCEDLEIRKLYQVVPDEAASADGLLRVVDESGEDYLYPVNFFLPIDLPRSIENALLAAA